MGTERETRNLIDDFCERRIERREFIKRAMYLGVGASLIGPILSACGSEESGESVGERVARLATENEDGEHPLNGQNISMTVLGIGGWLPSELAVNMAPMFNDFANENYGYTVNFSFDEAPFASLFQKAASSLGTQSQEYNIIISDSQWLGALAEPGWIVQMNDLISNVPELQNIEWYSDIVKSTYMNYPENSDQIWGLPQEGDTEALFLRKDMLEDPAEQQAFQQQYGRELPQTYDDFVDMEMSEFEDIAEFFTRPDQGIYGTLMQYSKEYDYASCYYYPFVFSQGGEIWNPETHNVYGILNTEQNAAALEEYKRWLKYMPPGAEQVGIAEEIDAFTQGRVFSAFQWAAVGLAMITEELQDKVLVVVPPKHGDGRTYTMGGQPWVINAFNDDAHMRVATDYLRWWYLPETQLEFARQGGNPCTRAALEDPEFDDLNPWNRAFKFMLQDGRSRDFWKDPAYAEMLSVQQEAFTAYVTGQVDDPMRALNYAACRQQNILYDAGRADEAPPDACDNISL